jgi:predicted nucleic acid-binding Zn ribbon protein
MASPSPRTKVPLQAARALLAGPELPSCPGCDAVLAGRQQACSGKCRAVLSRRRQASRQAARDAEIRRLLGAALRLLDDGRGL